MFLLITSFAAGMLTVLAPCILPILPVIIGGSVAEGTQRRPAVVVVSLGVSLFIFTLLLKASAAFVAVPALFWQLLSGFLILGFGIATLFPAIWEGVPGVNALYLSSNRALGSGYKEKSWRGEIVMGAALGPVFSSCSPTYFVILATVLPAHFATGILYLLAYVAGLCLLLFILSFLGQRTALRLGLLADSRGWFKKFLGLLFILAGIAIIFGWDKKLEAALPSGSFAEIGLEQSLLSKDKASTAPSAVVPNGLSSTEKVLRYAKAPEFVQPDDFINTNEEPISLDQYRGKNVVLIDFWDYSCINCQRTFPYLKAWYAKYKDQGLVIVGVHTPEFSFEQKKENVQAEAERFGLTYPIILDNAYQTWNAFGNQYWPREYLVDIDGYIVHDHAGEGQYDETEKAIQEALAERAQRLGSIPMDATSTVAVPPAHLGDIHSPETYLGSARNEFLGNGYAGVAGVQTLSLPKDLKPNTLYLEGTWHFFPEYAEAGAGASIVYQYGSHDVYLVATNPAAPVKLKVYRDGKPVGEYAGADVVPATSEATISGDRLYWLIHDSSLDVHIIRLEIESGTLDAYTLTFG